MTTEMQFTTTINAPVEKVFDLIADLARYEQWLSSSNLYGSMTKLSDNPAKLGTTYVDKGKTSVMQGMVTEYEAPRHITFQQSTKSKVLIFNITVIIRIRYTLDSTKQGTQVRRDIALDIEGIPGFAKSIIIKQIRAENERILEKMKAHLEKSN